MVAWDTERRKPHRQMDLKINKTHINCWRRKPLFPFLIHDMRKTLVQVRWHSWLVMSMIHSSYLSREKEKNGIQFFLLLLQSFKSATRFHCSLPPLFKGMVLTTEAGAWWLVLYLINKMLFFCCRTRRMRSYKEKKKLKKWL